MGCCGPRDCSDLRSDEMLDEADLDRFGGDGIRCPSCGSEVYHDAVLCHTCGLVLSDAELAGRRRGWVPITAAVVVVGVVLWAVL